MSAAPARGRSKATKRTGNSRSRSREKDATARSRSPGKGRKAAKGKGQRPADWSKDELLEKLKAFAAFSIDKSSGSGLLTVKDKRLMSEDYEIIIETFTRCKLMLLWLKIVCARAVSQCL